MQVFTHTLGSVRFFNLEQSRRDDLEALGYVLLYFCRGELPWQGMRAKTKKEKYQKIMDKKIATTPDEICKTFPEEFIVYFQYCRGLQFEEKPDYNYLRSLFKIIFDKFNYQYDFKYDWILIKKPEEDEETNETTNDSMKEGMVENIKCVTANNLVGIEIQK
jgi:casein kinase I family protein HRR25